MEEVFEDDAIQVLKQSKSKQKPKLTSYEKQVHHSILSKVLFKEYLHGLVRLAIARYRDFRIMEHRIKTRKSIFYSRKTIREHLSKIGSREAFRSEREDLILLKWIKMDLVPPDTNTVNIGTFTFKNSPYDTLIEKDTELPSQSTLIQQMDNFRERIQTSDSNENDKHTFDYFESLYQSVIVPLRAYRTKESMDTPYQDHPLNYSSKHPLSFLLELLLSQREYFLDMYTDCLENIQRITLKHHRPSDPYQYIFAYAHKSRHDFGDVMNAVLDNVIGDIKYYVLDDLMQRLEESRSTIRESLRLKWRIIRKTFMPSSITRTYAANQQELSASLTPQADQQLSKYQSPYHLHKQSTKHPLHSHHETMKTAVNPSRLLKLAEATKKLATKEALSNGDTVYRYLDARQRQQLWLSSHLEREMERRRFDREKDVYITLELRRLKEKRDRLQTLGLKDELAREDAALVIQRAYRCHAARRHVQVVMRAIACLQRAFRCSAAQKEKNRRERVATAMQRIPIHQSLFERRQQLFLRVQEEDAKVIYSNLFVAREMATQKEQQRAESKKFEETFERHKKALEEKFYSRPLRHEWVYDSSANAYMNIVTGSHQKEHPEARNIDRAIAKEYASYREVFNKRQMAANEKMASLQAQLYGQHEAFMQQLAKVTKDAIGIDISFST